MMAKTVATGVATTVLSAGLLGIWTVGGFVTGDAYAEDQNKLDTIIDILTYQQERKALVTKLDDLDGELDDAESYLEATPQEAGIYNARQSRLTRLKTF